MIILTMPTLKYTLTRIKSSFPILLPQQAKVLSCLRCKIPQAWQMAVIQMFCLRSAVSKHTRAEQFSYLDRKCGMQNFKDLWLPFILAVLILAGMHTQTLKRLEYISKLIVDCRLSQW